MVKVSRKYHIRKTGTGKGKVRKNPRKEFKIGDKVKINLKHLKKIIVRYPPQSMEKKEIQQIISRGGIVTIKDKKSGSTLDFGKGGMVHNTQYLIDYGFRVGTGGIPLNKVRKVV